MARKRRITYKAAGVDVAAGERLVGRIRRAARNTARPGLLAGIGGFSALFDVAALKYRHPVLVSSTDGVGTKLKVALMMNVHDTVGIDLVAMSVNDILSQGAEPLFFLDYVAMPQDDPPLLEQIVEGITAGCLESDCALLGGETAIHPGAYPAGEYTLQWLVPAEEGREQGSGTLRFQVTEATAPTPEPSPTPLSVETPTPGATETASGGPEPEEGGGGPDILLTALLTIAVAGGAAVVATLGYVLRRAIGFDLHRPPEGEEDGGH